MLVFFKLKSANYTVCTVIHIESAAMSGFIQLVRSFSIVKKKMVRGKLMEWNL